MRQMLTAYYVSKYKTSPFSHNVSKVKMYTEGGMSGKRRRENPEGHTEETEKNVT
jgi:hypothetical protein